MKKREYQVERDGAVYTVEEYLDDKFQRTVAANLTHMQAQAVAGAIESSVRRFIEDNNLEELLDLEARVQRSAGSFTTAES